MKKTNKKGFTLVELVIVIAVLAILAAIAIPTVTSVINNANKSAAASNAHQVQAAINSYAAKVDAGLITLASGQSLGTQTVADALTDYGTDISALTTKGGWELQYNAGKIAAVKNGEDTNGNAFTGTALDTSGSDTLATVGVTGANSNNSNTNG